MICAACYIRTSRSSFPENGAAMNDHARAEDFPIPARLNLLIATGQVAAMMLIFYGASSASTLLRAAASASLTSVWPTLCFAWIGFVSSFNTG